MDRVQQLVNIYYNHEWWHQHRLNKANASFYHRNMLERGNIVVYEEMGVVLGYYEVWFLTSEQLNRILFDRPFNPQLENLSDGKIAYLHNLYIDKQFRGGRVFRELHRRFKEQTSHCSLVVGREQNRKKRLRVFRNRR